MLVKGSLGVQLGQVRRTRRLTRMISGWNLAAAGATTSSNAALIALSPASPTTTQLYLKAALHGLHCTKAVYKRCAYFHAQAHGKVTHNTYDVCMLGGDLSTYSLKTDERKHQVRITWFNRTHPLAAAAELHTSSLPNGLTHVLCVVYMP